jgi:[ribosomal protein S18]-alanine N-acetyltransferase
VCWQGKDIAGFISGRRVLDEGEISNLAVRSEMRRKGVGKTLVEALLEVFSRAEVVQVFLEVRESNAAAIAFYRILGFCQIGKRAGYYRNPAEAALVLALTRSSSVSTI